MQNPEQQPYTILRIKRKRNEEPLDALVIESSVRRKKYRGTGNATAAGIFQFAQTIEDGAWEDDVQQKQIQDQLARLARQPQPSPSLPPQGTIPLQQTQTSLAPSISPPRPRREINDPNHRYTVVEHEAGAKNEDLRETVLSERRPGAEKANNNNSTDFKMYDAIRSEGIGKSKKKKGEEMIDSQMEKLLPMLQDYLKTTDPVLAESVSKPEDDNDFVWDLFYHKPGSVNDWTQTATVGTISGLPPLGTQQDSDSDSDSGVEDEADEDSNSEGYYKNDYPDEESESDSEESDSFHDGSDYDEVMHYYDDGSDHEWR
ncbi:hypothetical protein K435DRAFT_782950 [Dendrothele bispora CBS 962.96]|uniref:Probable RNA polymerase II nuclear localization protein SLC7A6OS n=1 Tax=Dendrothele bispora (strain CBS 962.96) TaxID=1314807 RepID=A0A4S8LBK0_DENBC|nr:hypothetical protein K435DRAFT_782950 [Dendrothele bispora CBS 962.96]